MDIGRTVTGLIGLISIPAMLAVPKIKTTEPPACKQQTTEMNNQLKYRDNLFTMSEDGTTLRGDIYPPYTNGDDLKCALEEVKRANKGYDMEVVSRDFHGTSVIQVTIHPEKKSSAKQDYQPED